MKGILQTKDYKNFIILDDIGHAIHEFKGAKLANKCLPGDHISWDEKCILELRDEHPRIVGTIESKTKYGFTKKHVPLYLFTPYNKSYPQFIVSCSAPTIQNLIGLITFDTWEQTFPRGHLEQVIGISGEYEPEKEALMHQASPYKYPKGKYIPILKETPRRKLNGYTFHIDPVGCRDVDDVLTFEKIEEGWRVTITISDVAAYVESDGIIDIFASLIGQTLYNNGIPIKPMLPDEYTEICSLLPGKTSYGVSLQFLWIPVTKEIRNIEWFESVFETNKSYTYDEFDRDESEYKPILKEIAAYLYENEVPNELFDSHKWIEQMMLFYNKEAGKMLKKANMGILRRHSAPNVEKLEAYPDSLKFLAFSSAEYCLAEDDSIHYGLQSEYAHASSPIRRYADLVNQRVIKLHLRDETYIVPIAMYDMNTRAKRIKNYERDLCFLDAVQRNTCKGIIIDTNRIDNNIKIKIYIPTWKKCVSVVYMYDEVVWSRDETREIDVTLFRDVIVTFTFNLNGRNWKERAIINI
jgi:exoribonuclease R